MMAEIIRELEVGKAALHRPAEEAVAKESINAALNLYNQRRSLSNWLERTDKQLL